MTVETLYATKHARGMLPRGLIEWLKIDIEPVDPNEKYDEFKTHFPLGKSPAFLGSNGFELTEVLAILSYLVNLKGDVELEKTLYGSALEERSQVIRILSFVNQEIALSFIALISAVKTSASQEVYDEKLAQLLGCFAFLEQRLTQQEFLVNDHITIADLYAAAVCGLLFKSVLGKDRTAGFSLLEKWLPKVLQHPALMGRLDTSESLEKTVSLPSAN
ncbi:LANO_0F00144g1_1 [Lachancea nothofagi CBS 11611]|uniref:LANO_0F00144g1_1 n=1 Tax=Lachancea nothofagi CBS 11611 TaxID=1266666 RepID=A0A1G4K538_9SACH|nr:LANO_0F00144g1_1 [Lachancea nothofagi CBS 11611]